MAKRVKKGLTMLPELRDIVVYQPNRVTNAKYNFTLMQVKVFAFTMHQLQSYISDIRDGTRLQQISLFTDEHDTFTIEIPMRYIGAANQYSEIRDSARQLMKIEMYLQDTKKEEITFRGLFSSVTLPSSGKRSGTLILEMHDDVARQLIHLDLNQNNRPKEYTSFYLEVVARAKNKYTPRIYMLISSWETTMGFTRTLEWVRDWLQIPEGQYPNYNDLKKRILVPVQEELKEMGFAWFNVGDADFEHRDGKKVTKLNFKVFTPDYVEIRKKQVANIKYMLVTFFEFTPKYIELTAPIYDNNSSLVKVLQKIDYLREIIIKDKGKTIRNVQAHVLRSLLNDFAAK